MRRRRHKLEVSTFPFLAVLLCAMGSLILLLLVIDRRAKAVARARAIAALERLEAEDTAAAVERAAELERRRQALHAVLENQAHDMLGKIQSVQAASQAALKSLSAEQSKSNELEARITEASSRLAERRAALSTRRATVADQTHLTDAAKKGLARLAAELAQLEQSLAALKALRQREKQMFSVVPYKGKRGDNRKPIYVECTEAGLVFHPDRKVLTDVSESGKEIRDEVGRRLELLRAASGATGARAGETAYLLMLVRPNGVKVYYHALAALSGLKVDFGYEFIDNDWVLDFPADDGPLRTQPWLAAQPAETLSTPSMSINANATNSTPRNPVRGVDFHANGTNGTGNVRAGTVTAPALAGDPARPPGTPGIDPLGQVGRPVPAQGAELARSGSSIAASTQVGPDLNGHGHGASLHGREIRGPGNNSTPGNGFGGVGAITSQSAYTPTGGIEPTDTTSGSGTSGFPGPSSAGGAESISNPASPGAVGAQGNAGGSASGSASIGAEHGNNVPTPSLSASVGPGGAPSTDSASGSTGKGSPRGYSPSSVDGEPVDGGDGAGSGLLSTLSPLVPKKKPKPAALIKRRPLNLNRDWHIPLECRADGVTIMVTQQHFTLQEIAQAQNNPLVLAVRQMIERRQDRVPEGEPPYRPLLRFQIKAAGLRAYYLAYPMLDVLNIPMMREDCDPESDIRAERNSR